MWQLCSPAFCTGTGSQAAPGMERGDVLSHPPGGWGKCEGVLQS